RSLDMFRQLFIDRIGSDVDDDERQDFSPLIEDIDAQEVSLGQQVLEELTKRCQKGAHFWNHLGRHQVYRLGRDENKAEEHLQRAIMLSPDDYIHHHTLGVVRRSRVRKMLSSLSNQTASHSLEIIAPHFEGAVDAFERTRTLNPENMHGYITHVQMILEVADHLKRASG